MPVPPRKSTSPPPPSAASTLPPKSGPLTQTLTTIKADNLSLITNLLRSSPSSSSPTSPVKQRLVFATTSLQNVLLRHVLNVPRADEVYARLKKLKSPKQPPKKEPPTNAPGNDVILPKHLGILSSRVLLLKEAQDSSTPNPQSKHTLGVGTSGTEVSLASSSSAFFTSAEDALDDVDCSYNTPLVTCFVKNDTEEVRAVCGYIKRLCRKLRLAGREVAQTHFRIVFVPHITTLSEKFLMEEGVLPLENVSVTSVPLDMIPLDEDVISLEMDSTLRDVELNGVSMDVVTTVARSIMKLQDVSKVIPRLQGLGELGEAVIAKVLGMRLEEFGYEVEEDEERDDVEGALEKKDKEEIEGMLILDRRVDLVSPMLTPLTYEGLLDEVLGIDCGFIQVDTNIIDPPSSHDHDDTPSTSSEPPPPPENVVLYLPLNDIDTLYSEVRDQHVETFGSFLQGQAKALKESHSAFTNKEKKKDLNEIHKFVKQIPIFTQNLRSLTTHIHLAELVKQTTEESSFRQRWQTERSMLESEQCYDMLEDSIACQEPPYQLLRLLCLQSLTSGGIKSAKFDSLRREVVQTYGYEYLFVLNNLEKAKLFRRKDTSWMDTASTFTNLRKQLALINAEVNTADPDDVSYVSSGYAPLTARLVQTATQGWTGKDEALRELPGRLIDVTQREIPEDFATSLKRSVIGPGLAPLSALATINDKKKPVLVVYFVGGVTLMEIAALRFLSKRPTFPFSIVCITTNIINGGTLLKSLS